MFCTKCGANNADNAKFCSQCGNPMANPAPVNPGGTFGEYSGGAKPATDATKRINPRDYFKAATNLDGTTITPPKPIVPDIPVEPPVVKQEEVVEAVNTAPVETPVEEPVEPANDAPITNAEVKVPEAVVVNVNAEAPATSAQAVKENSEQPVVESVQAIAVNDKAPSAENINPGVTVAVEVPVEEAKGKKKKAKKEKKKGGKKGLKIAGIVVLVLAILATVGFIFKDFLMFHLVPKIYTMSAVSKTMDVLNGELDMVGVNFTGVDPESEELTVKVSAAAAGIKGNGDLKDVSVDAAVSRSKKDSNFKISADASVNGKAYEIMDAIWDDSVIAVKSAGVLGEETVYTLPSKDFGKKFNESVHADKFNIPEDLDLSASRFIKDSNEVQDKETVNKLVEAMGKFVNSTEIENKETVKLKIDGKENSVHKIDYSAEDKDFANFMKDFVNIAKDSDSMRFVYDTLIEEYGSEEELEEYIDDIEFDDINISFYIYKGMVVRVDMPMENETVFFAFTKTENLLDNFTAGTIVEYENSDGEDVEYSSIMTCEGNLTTGGDKVQNVYTMVSEDDGEVAEKTVVTVTFDFKKGGFEVEIVDALDEREDAPVTVISGTCTRGKDGFKLAFGDITRVQGDVSYSMLAIAVDEVKLEIEITPELGVDIAPLDENRKEVLNMTDDELDELVEKISEGFENIISF